MIFPQWSVVSLWPLSTAAAMSISQVFDNVTISAQFLWTLFITFVAGQQENWYESSNRRPLELDPFHKLQLCILILWHCSKHKSIWYDELSSAGADHPHSSRGSLSEHTVETPSLTKHRVYLTCYHIHNIKRNSRHCCFIFHLNNAHFIISLSSLSLTSASWGVPSF